LKFSEVGAGTNIQSKQAHLLRCRDRRLGLGPNFVREGPADDVISHWHCLQSDCFFRLFSNSWKFIQNTSKKLGKFVSGGAWPLRPHSGCAIA